MKIETDVSKLPSVALADHRLLPLTSGVYVVYSPQGALYVGQSVSLRTRWQNGHHRTAQFVGSGIRIAYIELPRKQIGKYERELIEQLDPPLNLIRHAIPAPPIEKPKYPEYHCHKCDSDWTARSLTELPIQCPRCKSLSWNTPREKPGPRKEKK